MNLYEGTRTLWGMCWGSSGSRITCHSERSEESQPDGRFFAALRMTGKSLRMTAPLARHRCSGAIDEGNQNADHCQPEKGDGVLHMHIRVCNDVRDIRNEEKHSQSHTHDCDKDAEIEECRVLHS